MEDIEMIDVTLGPQQAINPDILYSPLQQKLGGVVGEGSIDTGKVQIRIGARPIVRDLRVLYEKADRKVPPNLEVFIGYDLWMITHGVSVVKQAKIEAVREIGCEIVFPDEPRVTVVEVLPQTKFIKRVGGEVLAEADISINGHAEIPNSLTELLNQVEGLSFGGKVKLGTKVNFVGRLAFTVMTPLIVAIGVGDTRSQWVFSRDTEPLIGDQLVVQILLVKKRTKKLVYKARVSAVVAAFDLLPSKWSSDWIDLSCSV